MSLPFPKEFDTVSSCSRNIQRKSVDGGHLKLKLARAGGSSTNSVTDPRDDENETRNVQSKTSTGTDKNRRRLEVTNNCTHVMPMGGA